MTSCLSLVLCRPVEAWQHSFEQLRDGGPGPRGWPGCGPPPSVCTLAEAITGSTPDPMIAATTRLAECIGGHLELSGPVTSTNWWPITAAERIGPGCARQSGQSPHGSGPTGGVRLGHRTPRRSLVRTPSPRPPARRQPGPATAPGRAGQHLGLRAIPLLLAARRRRDTRPKGRSGLMAVIEQLQGLEVAAGEWETAGPSGPGGRLRPPVARRAVPGR